MSTARSRVRAWGPWVAMALVLVVAIGYLLGGSDADPDPHSRAQRLATELRCPTCQGQSVAASNSSTAATIRRDIERRISQGEDDATIRQAYVDRYGEWVLLEPGSDGIGLLVWVLPVAVVVAGAAGIAAAIRRGRAGRGLVATDDDEALVARARRAREP